MFQDYALCIVAVQLEDNLFLLVANTLLTEQPTEIMVRVQADIVTIPY